MSHPTLDDLIAGSDTATLDTAHLAPLPRGRGERRTLDDLIAADTVQPDTSALHPRSPGDPGGNITLGPPVAPRPAPARGRGIGARIASLFGEVGQYGPGQEQSAGSTALVPKPEETRRPAYIPDRRTAEERAADTARAEGERSAIVQRRQQEQEAERTTLAREHPLLSRVTGFLDRTMPVRGGYGAGVGTSVDQQVARNAAIDDEVRNDPIALRQRFSPEQWRDIAKRGMQAAGRMNAEAVVLQETDPAEAERRHQDAEDVSRKAYNAQLLADGSEDADTFDAIALASMVGILHDPTAASANNVAAIRNDPRYRTFTPEEQTAILGKNLPVSTNRLPDPARDLGAPLLGSASLFVLGDAAALRAARAGASALGVEAAGARGMLARGLGKLAEGLSVEEAAAPPAPGLAGVRRDLAAFGEALPARARRGALIGQVPGAALAAREAQQHGEDVTPAVLGSIAANAVLGAAGEIVMPAAGLAASAPRRLLREGLQNMAVEAAQEGRATLARTLYRLGEDAFERADPRGGRRPAPPPPLNEPVDPEVAAPVEAAREAAGKTPLGDQTLEGQHATLARALESVLADKQTAATFGSEAGLIERPTGRDAAYTPRPEPVEANPPLRSSLDVARERAGYAPDDVRGEVDATVQMQRAAEEARLVEAQRAQEAEQLRLEQARQAADAARMGPLTLAQTIARASRDREAGEPLAAEYHDAINKMAEIDARMQDAERDGGTPSAKLRFDYARARAALNEARQKYGRAAGAVALVTLGMQGDTLTDDEKAWLGLAAVPFVTRAGEEGRVPSARPERLYNFELHTHHDLDMARIGDLDPVQQGEIIHALTKTVVEPVLESEGVRGYRAEPGMGGWFSEGNLSAQPSITLHLPEGLSDAQAHRIAARISRILRQSAFFDVKEKAGGGRFSAFFNFGREVDDNAFRAFMEQIAAEREGWNGFTRTTDERGNTVVQIVFDEGVSDGTTEGEGQRISDALDRAGYTGGEHYGREVQAREVGAARYDALARRGGRPAAHSRADALAENSYQAVARHVAIEANNRVYRERFEAGDPTREIVVPSILVRESGTSYLGANHQEAMAAAKRAGEEVRPDYSRAEGQQHAYIDGFDAIDLESGTRRFVTRAEADAILRYNANPRLRDAMAGAVDEAGAPKANARSEDLAGTGTSYRDLLRQVPDALRQPWVQQALGVALGAAALSSDDEDTQKLGLALASGAVIGAHDRPDPFFTRAIDGAVARERMGGGSMLWSRLVRAVESDEFGATRAKPAEAWLARLKKNSRINQAELRETIEPWLTQAANEKRQLTRDDILARIDHERPTLEVKRSGSPVEDEEMPEALQNAIDEAEGDADARRDEMQAARAGLDDAVEPLDLEILDHDLRGDRRREVDDTRQAAVDVWREDHPDASDEEFATWERDTLDPAMYEFENALGDYYDALNVLSDAEARAQYFREDADWADYRVAPPEQETHEGAQEYDDATSGGEYHEVRLSLDKLAGGKDYQESHWPGEHNVVVHYRARDFTRRVIPDKAPRAVSPEEQAILRRITETSRTLQRLNAQEMDRLRAAGVDVNDLLEARRHVLPEVLDEARRLKDERDDLEGQARSLRMERDGALPAQRGSRLDNTRVLFEVQSKYANEADDMGGYRREVPVSEGEQQAINERFLAAQKRYDELTAPDGEWDKAKREFENARRELGEALGKYAAERAEEFHQWYWYAYGVTPLPPFADSALGAFYEDGLPDAAVDAALDRLRDATLERNRLFDIVATAHDERQAAQTQFRNPGIVNPDAPGASVVASHRDAIALGVKQAVLDAVEDGIDRLAWATPEDRIALAALGEDTARLIYAEWIPSTLKALHRAFGLAMPKIERIAMDSYELPSIKLTPEFKRAVQRYGLPFVAVAALLATPEGEAKAQDASAEPSDDENRRSLYGTAAGVVAAGALVALVAKSKAARAALARFREMRAALSLDDLTGLPNRKAFAAAREAIDRDPSLGWLSLTATEFAKYRQAVGPQQADRAITEFGKRLRALAEDHGVPLRAFRTGAETFAVAAPKERLAEMLDAVGRASSVRGESGPPTMLAGDFGDTFAEAEANRASYAGESKMFAARIAESGRFLEAVAREQRARWARRMAGHAKNDRAAIDRLIDETRFYANPIGPAMTLLRRSPSAAGLAVVGALAATESDNEYVRRTGLPIIGLAALHAIGARRIMSGVDRLAQGVIDQLRKAGPRGTAVARFFNPDRLISPEARAAIRQYERERAKATAVATQAAKKAQALGPAGDRAVSDLLDREAWEGPAAQTPEVLTVALELADEYDRATKAQLAAGTLEPDQVLADYGGPRKYAHYEVANALADKPGRGGAPGPSPRIAKTNTRTLDIPIREAERALQAAQASGDPAAIRAATEALDEAQYHSYAQRLERGEIREASYRAAAGLEKAHQNVAAAKLFETLKSLPGVTHPEWVQAVTDYQTATSLARAARASKNQADIDATRIMVGDAAAHLDELKRRYKQKGQEWTALPDTPSWGVLRGAIVQRDVAHSLEGWGHPDQWGRALRAWKEVKTVFNTGTHVGNILSNVVALHVGDVPMWLQPAYYKRALKDLQTYGDGARGLAEAGKLGITAVNADGSPQSPASMRSAEGLETLLSTTRPETAEVIRRESEQNSSYAITEEAIAARRVKRRATGAAIGATVGAAKGYDPDHPERAFIGAAVGGGLGALAASGAGDRIRQLYGSEDNLARIAIYLRNRDLGRTHEEAVQRAIDGLADFRTRSPALRLTSRYLSPFILYQAKAVPAFATKIIEHPWKWLTLVAAWGAVNELSKREVGEIPEEDRDERDRATWGYFFPGFTQLPITNERGDKGATDVARYTPFGGLATGAPPGSVPEALTSGAPQVATPGGPLIDAALRVSNVNPLSRKPLIERDTPPERKIGALLHEAADFALPSSLSYHATRLAEDYDNRDWEKMKNDLLGPLGTKPRFVRQGAAKQRATYDYDMAMRAMQQRLRQKLRANRDPARVPELVERAMEEAAAAASAYKRRVTPPAPGTRP